MFTLYVGIEAFCIAMFTLYVEFKRSVLQCLRCMWELKRSVSNSVEAVVIPVEIMPSHYVTNCSALINYSAVDNKQRLYYNCLTKLLLLLQKSMYNCASA